MYVRMIPNVQMCGSAICVNILPEGYVFYLRFEFTVQSTSILSSNTYILLLLYWSYINELYLSAGKVDHEWVMVGPFTYQFLK